MKQRSGVRRLRVSGRFAVRGSFLLLIVVLNGACSPRRVAEILFVGDHFHLAQGLAYGMEERQRLDVYAPRAFSTPAPVIVFIYGGRWQSGSRREYRLLGSTLTRRGWVAVAPDYRLYPSVRFPAWVRDAADAVRWTRDNIHRFGGDPERIFVVGHSAGAHTATLLALDERYLRDAGVPPHPLRGFVALAGPVDTAWTEPDVQALMGPPEGWPETYPITHAAGAKPPLLLLHGTEDETVYAGNSVRLAEGIRAGGSCARVILYPGVEHVELVVALSVPQLRIAPVLRDLAEFVRAPDEVACASSPAAVTPAGSSVGASAGPTSAGVRIQAQKARGVAAEDVPLLLGG